MEKIRGCRRPGEKVSRNNHFPVFFFFFFFFVSDVVMGF